MTDGTSHPAHGTRPQARAASRGPREGCDGRPPAEWIERLIERVEATGRQMDALGGKLDRMDEKLEGVAYRRDIELFVARDEIERRIDKVVDGAKAEAAKGLAEVAGQVRDLRRIGWGLASAALLAFGGIVLAKIGPAGP